MRDALAILALTVALSSSCTSARCAEGFVELSGACVDPNAAGDCAQACGEHAFCDATVFPNACKCVAGYDGDPCGWVGVIDDPEFTSDIESSAWENYGRVGAVILPDEVSSKGRGEAVLDSSVVCNGGGLAQQVQMPPYGSGAPLIAEITYRTLGVGDMAIGFDRAWTELPDTHDEWQSETVCLGEGAYGLDPGGSQVSVRLAASERPSTCLDDEPGGIRVNRFVIRPSAESRCPAPGEVFDSGANGGEDGWAFTIEGDAQGGIAPNAGREATSGARLYRDAQALGRGVMTTRLSVPLPDDEGFPALALWWRGSAAELFDAKIWWRGSAAELSHATSETLDEIERRGRPVETLVGTGAGQNYLYCLPPWTHGSVLDLSFALRGDHSDDPQELAVDEIELRTTEACSSGTELLDPGFEAAPIRWFGSSLGTLEAAVLMQADRALARDGSEGVLELKYWTRDAEISVETYVLVPEMSDAECPVARFYSRSTALPPSTQVRWLLGRADERSDSIQTLGTWELNEVPLPSSWSGRWYRLRLEVSPLLPLRGTIGDEQIFLDDFSLGTTTDCPVP
jgi:hypothetical protein